MACLSFFYSESQMQTLCCSKYISKLWSRTHACISGTPKCKNYSEFYVNLIISKYRPMATIALIFLSRQFIYVRFKVNYTHME